MYIQSPEVGMISPDRLVSCVSSCSSCVPEAYEAPIGRTVANLLCIHYRQVAMFRCADEVEEEHVELYTVTW